MKLFQAIADVFYDIQIERSWGTSWRFIIANIILGDSLRETISFARHDIESAYKYMDISPQHSKRQLCKAYKDLSCLGEFKTIDLK